MVVSSHCFFSVFQVLLKLAFANCRLKACKFHFLHLLGLPPFRPPTGEHPMAHWTCSAFIWQVHIIFQLASVQNWIRKKKIIFLVTHTHDVRCKPATLSLCLSGTYPCLLWLFGGCSRLWHSSPGNHCFGPRASSLSSSSSGRPLLLRSLSFIHVIIRELSFFLTVGAPKEVGPHLSPGCS